MTGPVSSSVGTVADKTPAFVTLLSQPYFEGAACKLNAYLRKVEHKHLKVEDWDMLLDHILFCKLMADAELPESCRIRQKFSSGQGMLFSIRKGPVWV